MTAHLTKTHTHTHTAEAAVVAAAALSFVSVSQSVSQKKEKNKYRKNFKNDFLPKWEPAESRHGSSHVQNLSIASRELKLQIILTVKCIRARGRRGGDGGTHCELGEQTILRSSRSFSVKTRKRNAIFGLR